MSVKGFSVNGAVEQYDAEALANVSSIIDTTLTQSGKAADAKATGDELSDLKSSIGQMNGFNAQTKAALLALFQKCAFVDDDAQTYYNALEDALYPTADLDHITATYSGGSVMAGTDIETLRSNLTVLAVFDDSTSQAITTYVLSGSLVSNPSAITVTYGGKSTTVSIPVIALDSIIAVYTQSGTVYDTDALDSLKPDLVVTAHYSDSTTATVTTYTLSGTLTEGTSTITVSYGGKTTTFDVTVTVDTGNTWLYRFEQSLASSGTQDFGFQGTPAYTEGPDGGDAYWHKVGTEGSSATDEGAIYATGIQTVPDFSGDFTISFWNKSFTALRGAHFNAIKSISSATIQQDWSNIVLDASGWTVAKFGNSDYISKTIAGIRLCYIGQKLAVCLFATDDTSPLAAYFTPPSSFDTTQWHHWAITREDDLVRFFVDGELIWHATYSKAIYFPDQVCIGSFFGTGESAQTPSASSYSDVIDDLYVAEYCKFASNFDPATITY